MRINNNLMAMNAYRQLGITNNSAAKAMEKLSSGYRINRAGDDAAGLAISEKMRGQIRGLNMASKNAQDGISLIQTAEGALQESHAILQRMRELAVQSANDTNIAVDRSEIQKEIDQLAQELTRIANDTEFNQQTLLNGGIKNTKFHIGANQGQDITLAINPMDAFSLGVADDMITREATIGAGSDISNVALADTVGSQIVDQVTISFQYSSESAKAAVLEGNDVSALYDKKLGDLLSTSSIIINGVSINLTETVQLDGSSNAFNINDLKNALQTDISAVFDGVDHEGITFIVDINGDALTITSGATGSSAEIEITANADSAVLGLTEDATTDKIATGADAGYYITVSDDSGSSKLFSVDATATTFSTGTDAEFGGITINLAEDKTLADLDGDSITIANTVIEAKAAVIDENDPSNVQKAVAPKGINVSTQENASKAITIINKAIETVSAERSKLGAYQNRLEHTIWNLDTSAENLQASESRIRDVDYAEAA
jgi:flagellin